MNEPDGDRPTPTEPIEVTAPAESTVPAESSVPAAASPRSWHSRHRTALIGGLAAVLAIGCGVGIGVAAAGGSNTPHPVAASPPASPTPSTAPNPSSPPAKAHRGTRATIVSEAGSTWTVRTMSGNTMTVTLTSKTKFGTKKAPATAAQFTAGQTVLIAGTVNSDSITATRIAAAPTAAKAATPRPTPTTTAPTA